MIEARPVGKRTELSVYQSQRSSLSYSSMVAQILAKINQSSQLTTAQNPVLVTRSHSRTNENRVGTEKKKNEALPTTWRHYITKEQIASLQTGQRISNKIN